MVDSLTLRRLRIGAGATLWLVRSPSAQQVLREEMDSLWEEMVRDPNWSLPWDQFKCLYEMDFRRRAEQAESLELSNALTAIACRAARKATKTMRKVYTRRAALL